LGPCFKCKGAGKLEFVNDAATRATNRAKTQARAVRKSQDAWTNFAAEFQSEAEWIVATAPRFEFAAQMRVAVEKYGALTDAQLAAVRRCMARDAQRSEERAAQKAAADARSEAVDATPIERAFAIARERANRPGALGVWTRPLPLRANEIDVTFQPGSIGSQWEGMLFVKASDGKKLGSIANGKFRPRFECSPAEQAAVVAAASRPGDAARAYGKAWSVCCVCGQTLTNDDSIARGIGPVCAEKYGF
jgi:hypothetical protein